jgi:hypothetical protein
MSPESGQSTDALAPDTEAAAVELVNLVVYPKAPCGPEQLLEAGTTHEVALFLGGQNMSSLVAERSALPGRNG